MVTVVTAGYTVVTDRLLYNAAAIIITNNVTTGYGGYSSYTAGYVEVTGRLLCIQCCCNHQNK